MSNKRLTTQTLGKYLGAECEIRKGDGNAPAQKFSDRIRPQYLSASTLIVTPILRKLESMTEEEAIELFGFYSKESLADDPIPSRANHTDFLRSKGFDCGGNIEVRELYIINTDMGTKEEYVWREVWVPSLIDAGLAKAKE